MDSKKGENMNKTIRITDREAEVIRLIANGHSNKEVADKLFISIHTVKAYLEHIYEKLGINNRVRLALWAYKNNII